LAERIQNAGQKRILKSTGSAEPQRKKEKNMLYGAKKKKLEVEKGPGHSSGLLGNGMSPPQGLSVGGKKKEWGPEEEGGTRWLNYRSNSRKLRDRDATRLADGKLGKKPIGYWRNQSPPRTGETTGGQVAGGRQIIQDEERNGENIITRRNQ